MSSRTLRPIVAALRTGNEPVFSDAAVSSRLPVPFVTISRMAGAGGRSLARALISRLNAVPVEKRRIQRDWQSFDRELIEQIAADHAVSASLLETIEDRGRNWLADILREMGGTPLAAEEAAYRQVAQSIVALAHAGHTIIVGRGGAFVTSMIPGGVHVLIVAPHGHRIKRIAADQHVSDKEAERLVRSIDENRADFYRRHWPGKVYGPESFTLTLNSAELSDQRMAEAVAALVR